MRGGGLLLAHRDATRPSSGPLCHAAWAERGQHKHNLRYLLAYDVKEGRGVISDANLAIAPGGGGKT